MKHFQPFVLLAACWIPFDVSAAGPIWETVECVPVDTLPEQTYEAVELLDDFESDAMKWTAVRGAQNAEVRLHRDDTRQHSGTASMRADYRFTGQQELQYIQLTKQVTFSMPGLGIGFWLHHDGTPFTLRLRFLDSSGENHQVELLGAAKPGWQFVVGQLDSPSTTWGGDGNGNKDYPCRLSGIVVDRPGRGFQKDGSLWIDEITVVRRQQVQPPSLHVETATKTFGNLFAVGDTITLRASGHGERIRWNQTDFFARELASGTGPAAGTQVPIVLDRPGWHACDFQLVADGKVVETRSFRCAALINGAELRRSDFVGVCSHFGQNRYPIETMDLMRRYGIDQYRDEIGWQSYELQKGQYAMPDHASAFLKRSAELKMRPLLIFDYSNSHYDNGGYPNSPEAIDGFASYAVDLARQTQGTAAMFEIWNEWVGGCGMKGRSGQHDGQAYGRLLKPTYQAVKSAFPDLTLVGIGGEYGEHCADNIVATVAAAGPDSMDAWSIHPYRYPRSPESSALVDEVTRIAQRVEQTGVKTKPWVTEIGYPTHRASRGSSLQQQARYCLRTLLLLQGTQLVEKVFWYDLKDDGLSQDYNEHNFGLIHHQQFNCAPKPGIVAVSVLIRMTAAAECLPSQRHDDIYIAKYRRADDRHVLVVWTTRESARLRLTKPPEAVYDMMGAKLQVSREVEISETPVYIVGRELEIEAP